jgi:FkbH-like protein
MDRITLQIAATFTAEPLKASMGLLLNRLQIPAELCFSAFNQVFQELLTPGSAFYQNSRGANLVLVRLEDLGSGPDQGEKLAAHVDELIGALHQATTQSRVPTMCAICPPSRSALTGSLGERLGELTARAQARLQDVKGLRFISGDELTAGSEPADYDNPRGNRLGAVPYTPRFYAILGERLTRMIYRLAAPPHKVIVLDCDQTLWKGVCGEDGPQGVLLDLSRKFLQEFMVEQSRAGKLLCLCSKNNEPDVWEVFEQRADMPLKREHVVSARINWEPKSENIKSLARELKLGLDSFIFVDDDGAVCSEVQANCPEVLTIHLPDSTEKIPELLRHHWAFDRLQATEEDRQRTELYRQNAERSRLLESSASLEEFLESLELKCDIGPISPDQIARVSQLTQRTNQFNASTVRRDENELQQVLRSPSAECLTVYVSDRFGDYGLVGVMICFRRARDLEVDTFLLSCRALGRGVEHRMLAWLGRLAVEAGLDRVTVRFAPSKKNQPVRDFLERTGSAFRQTDGTGAIFAYPAKAAFELTYKPEASVTRANGEPESTAQNPGANGQGSVEGKARAAALYEIASKLHDPDALLKALEPEQAARPKLAATYTVAESATEKRLLKIWEELLKVSPIGVDDDYFELGGDSLMAVSLFVEIEQQFAQTLSLAALFSSPTVRKLAGRLDGQTREESWRYLVPIQAGGSTPPLFCMHAAGGNVLFYRDLARHLGPYQRVYGLQAREMPETGTYLDRVEDMAAEYLKEVVRFRPEGPYHLCGSSFGGLLAYEAAQQLKAQGREVGILALFDTYGPGYPQRLPSASGIRQTTSGLLLQLKSVKGRLGRMNAREQLDFVRSKAQKVAKKLTRKWLYKKNEFQLKYSQALGKELPKDLQRNHKAIQRALSSYVPKPYDGRITLYRAGTQPEGIVPDHLLGWRGLPSQGIEVFESPGTHGAMTVDPYAAPLAELLGPVLKGEPVLHGEALEPAHAI